MTYLMQAKIEEFVHKSIREILLVGHRQAFAWIDEWFGMSLQDVRDYENRMQEETNEKVKMAGSAPPTPQPLEEEAGGSAYGTPASTPTSPTGSGQKRGGSVGQARTNPRRNIKKYSSMDVNIRKYSSPFIS